MDKGSDFFDSKFDLIFSIGDTCAAAMYLDKLRLRTCSLPFDWNGLTKFIQRFDSLVTRFSGFLDKDNLDFVGGRFGDEKCDGYVDRVQGYCFAHDFPAHGNLDKDLPAVKEKYDRRCSRLLKLLDGGVDACMVWWSKDKIVPDEDCICGLEKIRSAFPRSRVKVLVMENAVDGIGGGKGRWTETQVSPDCLRVRATIWPEGSALLGDEELNLEILRRLKCGPALAKARRKTIFIRRLSYWLSFWHPSKDARRTARENWTKRLRKVLA